MSNEFKDYGRALLDRGYLILPIKPGSKRPAMDGWQHARLGTGDLRRYPHCGVGVLCGQGVHPVVGLDIDTQDPEVASSHLPMR